LKSRRRPDSHTIARNASRIATLAAVASSKYASNNEQIAQQDQEYNATVETVKYKRGRQAALAAKQQLTKPHNPTPAGVDTSNAEAEEETSRTVRCGSANYEFTGEGATYGSFSRYHSCCAVNDPSMNFSGGTQVHQF